MGIWHKDKFMGRKFMPPKVIHDRGTDRHRFDRVSDGDQIMIQFLMKDLI